MHGAMLLELAEARRADLLREAAQARRITAARRHRRAIREWSRPLFRVSTARGIGRKREAMTGGQWS